MRQEISLRTPDPLSAFREGLGTRLGLGMMLCTRLQLTTLGWKFSALLLLRRVIANWVGCTTAGCCPLTFILSRPAVLKRNSRVSVVFLEYFTAMGPELLASFRNDFRDCLSLLLASFRNLCISSIWSSSVVFIFRWACFCLASDTLWCIRNMIFLIICACTHTHVCKEMGYHSCTLLSACAFMGQESDLYLTANHKQAALNNNGQLRYLINF